MKEFRAYLIAIREELSWKQLKLNHDTPEDFVLSMCQSHGKSLRYLIYRWCLATFFIGLFIGCLVYQFSDGKLFIYLTNWGIILCIATNLLAAILVTMWYFNLNHFAEKLLNNMNGSLPTPMIFKVYWLLHNVTLLLAMKISIIYWVFLFEKQNKPVRYQSLNILSHACNSILMISDMLVIRFPYRFLHVCYVMLFPIIYFTFSLFYFLAGGVDEYNNHYIYIILDWTKPKQAMKTFGAVFALYLILAIFVFIIYKIKMYVCKYWTCDRSNKNQIMI